MGKVKVERKERALWTGLTYGGVKQQKLRALWVGCLASNLFLLASLGLRSDGAKRQGKEKGVGGFRTFFICVERDV